VGWEERNKFLGHILQYDVRHRRNSGARALVLSLLAIFTKTGSWLGVILFGSRVFGLVWSGELGLAKLRLFVRFRKSNGGYYIASVPLKRLVVLSGFRKRRWDFEDGWLVLEAF
jgi:hypothetical protein